MGEKSDDVMHRLSDFEWLTIFPLLSLSLSSSATCVETSQKCREKVNRLLLLFLVALKNNIYIAAAVELENEQSRHVIYSNYTALSLLCIILFFAKRVIHVHTHTHAAASEVGIEKGAKIRLRLSTPYVLLPFLYAIVILLLLLFKKTIQLASYWENESK